MTILMKHPDITTYKDLYKNYLERSPENLVDRIKISPGMTIADLCGGNGRLALYVQGIGATVTLVDMTKDMIPNDLKTRGITVYNCKVDKFLSEYNHDLYFDAVFCQQGINFWFSDDPKIPEMLASIIKKNGYFVFNTFYKKPPETLKIKDYMIDGKQYHEVSYLIKDTIVMHTQIREGIIPHVTEFYWISEEQFAEKLNPYFEIERTEEGSTAIYICKKK
jgi:ubiquinone/menaquinone biosynthesis C-methylase UbiE